MTRQPGEVLNKRSAWLISVILVILLSLSISHNVLVRVVNKTSILHIFGTSPKLDNVDLKNTHSN